MKILFISNITNEITNFAIPSIYASKNLGIEFHHAANWSNVSEDMRKKEEEKYGIKIHNIDFERNPFRLRNYKAYKQLLNLMKGNSFDVVHCNTPIGGILGRICAKQSGVSKVIYTAHGFHFYEGAPKINNTVYKAVERILGKLTDTIITMNIEDYNAAKNFKLRNNGKVYYVPGVGVNSNEYQLNSLDKSKLRGKLGLKDDDIVLITIGELINRKNHETSIKSIYKSKNNKIKLLICGEGSQKDELIKLVKELGLEDRIYFLGFRTDIKELLNISDIFIFPSYQEGLPRAMMEAMSSGLPCIASSIRGNVDLINNEKGGYLHHPNDVDAFANSINIISSNKELRTNMKKINLQNIGKFDIENIKSIINKIYKEELML